MSAEATNFPDQSTNVYGGVWTPMMADVGGGAGGGGGQKVFNMPLILLFSREVSCHQR